LTVLRGKKTRFLMSLPCIKAIKTKAFPNWKPIMRREAQGKDMHVM